MKRALVLLTVWLACAAHACAVKDDAGLTVGCDVAPARIVSLLPSLTETVCALGACGRLVGVDRYSNWPQTVQQLSKVGGGLDVNVEAVSALEPDLVLIADSSPAAVRLRALGLKVAQLEPHTGADLRRVVVTLGQLLRVDGAAQLLHDMDAGVQAAAQALPARARGLRVYFEVSPAPYAAGRASFIGELLERLGLDNIVGPQQGPFPRLNPEFVVRAAPQLIMVSDGNLPELARRPGWAALAALRTGSVCAFDAGARDILVRPGPRIAAAARLLAHCVATHLPPESGATSP